MRRFRRLLLLRVSVAGLLGSFGLGLAAPVATADERAHAQRLALDVLPSDVIAAALAADTEPAAFADALVAALEGDAPAAEQVLDALYGQLLRVFRLEQGTPAVFVAAGSASAAGLSLMSTGPAHRTEAFSAVLGSSSANRIQAEAAGRFAPRTLRPAVQPLGP
jgi:hypothetical protein